MPTCAQGCDCDCCAGISVRTPVAREIPSGLAAFRRRAGDHASFRESMLATLSLDPRARPLRTRAADDPAIALCDAAAGMLDVLAFYGERIASEHYLQTATEPRSVEAMAALVGYSAARSVAASADLAFTVQGASDAVIPAGTRAQSVPGPGEVAQTFETVADIDARVDWNAIAVATDEPWVPRAGDRELWVDGLGTGLGRGDSILLVGEERLTEASSGVWETRVLDRVDPDVARGLTRLSWRDGLSSHWTGDGKPAAVHACTVKAGLFGGAAPQAALFVRKDMPDGLIANGEWVGFTLEPGKTSPGRFDLDSVQAAVVPGSWAVLASANASALFRVGGVQTVARAQFGLSGKITRVMPDNRDALTDERFPLRGTAVLAGTMPLSPAGRPLGGAVEGDRVLLVSAGHGLTVGQRIALRGKRAHVRVVSGGGVFTPTSGPSRPLAIGEVLAVTSPIERTRIAGRRPLWSMRVLDSAGVAGTISALATGFDHEPAPEKAEAVSTAATIAGVDGAEILLREPLPLLLDRASTRINANVAPALSGESVQETLGGSTGRADQRFVLKQTPVADRPAANPDGRASLVEVRVNDLLWSEVPSLAGCSARDRVFARAEDAEGRTVIVFGDGVEGAIPPSGRGNIRARYLRGQAGDAVHAEAVTTLLTRPLGVSEVTNPAPSANGVGSEPIGSARINAPLQARTLGRAVSVQDYADLARNFAGIAKARADWIAVGPGRGILLTVAATGGSNVDPSSDLAARLGATLSAFGDPVLPVRVVSYRPARFHMRVGVSFSADADPATELPRIRDLLAATYAFDVRDFGQAVTADQVAALLHAAFPTLLSVRLLALHLEGHSGVVARLFARLPAARRDRLPDAAELLLPAVPPIVEVIT